MRDPWIAAVGVVLDDDEPSTGPQVPRERPDDFDLPIASDVVQAVGRDEPVELGECERTGQVRGERRELDRRETGSDRCFVRPERPRVTIDRHDPPARSEQVGEGKRERALPCPDVRPRPARLDRGAEEADVIMVVHGALPGALEPGRHAVDGQLDEPKDTFALGVIGRHRPQAAEQPDLELRQ